MLKRVPLLLIVLAGVVLAEPPKDLAARKIYDHDSEWLSHFPSAFIATNMRGDDDSQYPERRQAALDLLRKKRDLAVVSDLTDELKRGSFLSGDICETLGEWRSKKALPVLEEVAVNKKRPKDVQEKAEKAIQAIKSPVREEAAPSRPVY